MQEMNVGENWLIQTVTHYVLGTIEKISPNEIWLKANTVSWIAVTGRFHNFMKVGVIKETEVEPFGDVPVLVKQQAIVICSPWKHPLPNSQQ